MGCNTLAIAAAQPSRRVVPLPQVGHTIQALAARDDFTYAAYDSSVAVFRRCVTTGQCVSRTVC